MRHVCFCAAIVAILNGCATYGGRPVHLSPGSQLLAEVAVEYATGKVIEAKSNPAERIQRAARIKSVALAIQSAATGDTTTVGSLAALAESYIADLKLQPSDLLLAHTLVNAVVAELNARIQGGILKPDDLLVVKQVLGWVLLATEPYLTATPLEAP